MGEEGEVTGDGRIRLSSLLLGIKEAKKRLKTFMILPGDIMEQPETLFKRWYIEPLKVLEKLPNGDGGFIALIVSCALYERYATAVIVKARQKVDKTSKLECFMFDFETDKTTAEAFWDVIRDGLAHQAMPKQTDRNHKVKYPTWSLCASHLKPAELTTIDGTPFLKIQPWLFMNKVISLWEKNIHMLTENQNFPWGNIMGI